MKSIIIPVEFLKAIGEKKPYVRIYWLKWLADYTDEFFRPDFCEFFLSEMKDKNLSLETIKEAYNIGLPYFKDGFTFSKQPVRITPEQKNLVQKVLDYLNVTCDSFYTQSKANRDCILSRVAEGYNFQDFKRVIDRKASQWKNTEQGKYLRPITLFQAKKFENYLNEPETIKNEPKSKSTGSIGKLSGAASKAKRFVG